MILCRVLVLLSVVSVVSSFAIILLGRRELVALLLLSFGVIGLLVFCVPEFCVSSFLYSV